MNLSSHLLKVRQVAIFEYQRQVFTWRFWLGILGVPVMLAGMLVLTVLATLLALDDAPVGVVGAPGLDLTPPPGERFAHSFIAFDSEGAAQSALLAREIQAYYVLPGDYPGEREVRLVYLKRPSRSLAQEFTSLLRRQALAELPPERAFRLSTGSLVILQSGRFELPAQVPTMLRLMIAFGVIYMLMLVNSQAANYTVSTITDERNNRTLEVLVTSLGHTQLLAGKITGQLAVVLTQMLLLGSLPFVFFLSVRQLIMPLVGEIFTWQQLLIFLAAGFLNLVLVSVLLSVLGIAIFDPSETQLAVLFFNICMIAPMLLFQALADAPSGPVSLFLTFFPLSGASALIVRMSLGSVPAWQVALSLLLLLVSTRGAFWLAGRVFWRGLQDRQPFKLRFARFKSFFRRAWKTRNA